MWTQSSQVPTLNFSRKHTTTPLRQHSSRNSPPFSYWPRDQAHRLSWLFHAFSFFLLLHTSFFVILKIPNNCYLITLLLLIWGKNKIKAATDTRMLLSHLPDQVKNMGGNFTRCSIYHSEIKGQRPQTRKNTSTQHES